MECSTVRSESECGVTPGCIFDFDCQVCRGPLCRELFGVEDCGVREDCTWDGVVCYASDEGVDCGTLFAGLCEQVSGCTLDTTYGVCHEEGGQVPCSVLPLTDCDSSGHCESNADLGLCQDAGADVPCYAFLPGSEECEARGDCETRGARCLEASQCAGFPTPPTTTGTADTTTTTTTVATTGATTGVETTTVGAGTTTTSEAGGGDPFAAFGFTIVFSFMGPEPRQFSTADLPSALIEELQYVQEPKV